MIHISSIPGLTSFLPTSLANVYADSYDLLFEPVEVHRCAGFIPSV